MRNIFLIILSSVFIQATFSQTEGKQYLDFNLKYFITDYKILYNDMKSVGYEFDAEESSSGVICLKFKGNAEYNFESRAYLLYDVKTKKYLGFLEYYTTKKFYTKLKEYFLLNEYEPTEVDNNEIKSSETYSYKRIVNGESMQFSITLSSYRDSSKRSVVWAVSMILNGNQFDTDNILKSLSNFMNNK